MDMIMKLKTLIDPSLEFETKKKKESEPSRLDRCSRGG